MFFFWENSLPLWTPANCYETEREEVMREAKKDEGASFSSVQHNHLPTLGSQNNLPVARKDQDETDYTQKYFNL